MLFVLLFLFVGCLMLVTICFLLIVVVCYCLLLFVGGCCSLGLGSWFLVRGSCFLVVVGGAIVWW